jgi:hypothetical protein
LALGGRTVSEVSATQGSHVACSQRALSSSHTNPVTNTLAHRLKHESNLAFSPLLLTVLNLLHEKKKIKQRLWEEILVPKLKAGRIPLSQILKCRETQMISG